MATKLEPGGVYTLSIDQIKPSPLNRKRAAHTNKEYIKELAEQIGSNIGQIHAGIARPHADDPTIADLIVGKCRYLACKKGKMPMRVEIRDITDDDALEMIAAENLTRMDTEPWEVATSLLDLLRIHNDDYARVADRIRRTPEWVAKHASLADLQPEIIKAWQVDDDWVEGKLHGFQRAEGCTELAGWTIGHMLLIARLAPSAQRAMLAKATEHAKWGDTFTIPELRQHIASEYTHRLADAPFDVAKAPVCASCPKRSSCRPELFDDVADLKKDDRCLDPACWQEKIDALVAAEIARVTELDGDPPIRITREYHNKPDGTEYANNWEAKSQKKGGKRAVFIDGPKVGTSGFVAKPKYGAGTGNSGRKLNADGTAVPTPLKDRRAKLAVKRWNTRLERLHDLIAGPDEDGPDVCARPAKNDVLRLAIEYGTGHIGLYRGIGGPKQRKDALAAFRKSLEEEPEIQSLWPAVRMEVAGAISTSGGQHDWIRDAVNPEACLLAGVLLKKGWWEEQGTLCETEHPEPKSWAKLNADGTPKKSKKKKGAKS